MHLLVMCTTLWSIDAAHSTTAGRPRQALHEQSLQGDTGSNARMPPTSDGETERAKKVIEPEEAEESTG